MKLSKFLWVFIMLSSIACSKQGLKKEVWDFSYSRDKTITRLKFNKDGEHEDYTSGKLKIIFPEYRIFKIFHKGYHVCLDESSMNEVEEIVVYLPEMTAADLEKTYNNYVKKMDLDIGIRPIMVNLKKPYNFDAEFGNIYFCMLFKRGVVDKDKYIGFIRIVINPFGPFFLKD